MICRIYINNNAIGLYITHFYANLLKELVMTGQLYHFATDFDRVLLQLADNDIVNALFKYKLS